ncbi:MAG: threonylcarbamoyl-AMP synthase [Bacteroidales bacterium]|nr:threonylcarbamoyl-AMP synthase [Candidatus Cryptobacteroides caccocaballi]
MNTEELNKAVKVLREGGIILYPTDTVWGIGCDATNPEAVAKVYQIKKRSDSKSLVLLASDVDMICKYVKEIPEIALQLIDVNDKPMTIIYPDAVTGKYGLAENAVAEDGTVGIRIPMMDFCKDLCVKLGRPVVSTSANISGEATPKKYADVSDDIRSSVDHIVDPALEAGATGLASQIIKVGMDYSIQIIRG